MTKEIRYFVQYLYKKENMTDSYTEELDETFNENIIINDNTLGFRFFEKEDTYINSKLVNSEIIHTSGWIYIGKRMDYNEIVNYFKSDTNKMLKRVSSDNKRKSICITKFGNLIPMEEEDIVFDEYVIKNKLVLK